jgi:transcriptional regulator with XRE-family HTH domain
MHEPSPLGISLRQRRQALSLSLSQLADSTGLHKSFLSRLESGVVRQPSADSLQRVAAALGLPETEVFGLLDDRARGQLPALQPYLRAKYDLPDEAIAEITAYLNRYGHVSEGAGPRDGEDEEPEQRA